MVVVDLRFNRMDISNGGEIEIPSPDKRVHALYKILADWLVAGYWPGLDHR